jgi:polar amino acid transport system substrate-binding protein
MKKAIIHLAACAFLFAASVIGCAKQQAQGLTIVKCVLTVGVEIGYPPMEYFDADGALVGFDIELTKALAARLGLRINFIDTAWEGILAGLDSGRYDIAVNITILPERQKRHNFTKPYIDSSIAIVIRKDSNLKIEKPQDIEGLRVSFQGDTTAQYFTEKLNEQAVKFSPFSYDKIMNCFDDLKLGRVDLVVADNIAAFHYAGKEDSPFLIVWQGQPDESIGICLKKGNDALTAALNKALDELFAEGAMAKIHREIFGNAGLLQN